MEGAQKVAGDWEEVDRFVSDGIPIAKFRSNATGLTLVHAAIEGPLVYGYFALATEAHDNFGLPHTLEHAIFLGSEIYPYKGVLDSLANRCLARGTNAWTDTDHTCYTVEVAGSEGFLNILPVYLDHILYPTLTDSGFHTEVHHINEEGEDAGVVYCEMQARENTEHSIIHRKLLETLYPGDCGYRYETGGMVADIRRLTAEQVRQYHRDFYRIDNLCVIINGKVDIAAVFEALKPVEAKVLSKGRLPPMARPWTSPVPPFSATVEHRVPFPADDESVGTAVMGWRGPSYHEFETITALRVLWEYLTDSAVSPLRHTFVDIPDPYCSEIDWSFVENSVFVQYLSFENAPKEKMDEIKPKFFELMDFILRDGIDMKRMAAIIHRQRLKHLSGIETKPHDTYALKFISDFLYGEGRQLQPYLSELQRLQHLQAKDSPFWLALIKKYLLEQPHGWIVGEPSMEAAKKLADEEKARVQAQAQALGEAKLAELAHQLEAAIEANEVPIPNAELEKFPIPDVSRIPFIPIWSYRNHEPLPETEGHGTLKNYIFEKARTEDSGGDHPTMPPFFIQFDDIPSVFVKVTAIIDTTNIPDHYRPFLELYLDLFFEAPIAWEGGKYMSHEEVVRELTNDTVAYSNELGFGGSTFAPGSFAQALCVSIKSEVSKYDKTVEWLKNLLWNSRFTKERIIISAQKLVNDVAQHKRDGMDMVMTDVKHTNFDSKRSNLSATNAIKQHRFLTSLLAKFETDEGAKEVCEELERFRGELCQPHNLRIQVAANITAGLPNPLRPWTLHFLPKTLTPPPQGYLELLAPLKFSHEFLTELATHPNQAPGNILVLAIESSYLIQSCEGPRSFHDPDIPPLMVLNEYLTTMEGPFWKQIRGQGLAYSYSIRLRVEQGMIHFVLFKSGSLAKAYEEARKIIHQFASKAVELDETALAAARSSVIFGIISREETAPAAATQSITNYLSHLPHDANKRMLEQVKAVTMGDLYRVLDKYFTRLFDPAQTNLSITTSVTNAPELKKFFEEQYNKKLTIIESLDQHYL